MKHNSTNNDRRIMASIFWMLCCAAVVCSLALTSRAIAQTVGTDVGGTSPEGVLNGFAIDGDMRANQPKDSILFNHASDWFDNDSSGLPGFGVGVLNLDGTPRSPSDPRFGASSANILTIANV